MNSANKSVEMAMPDDEVDGFFYHPRKRGREMKPKKERRTYLSLCHLSHFDGTMKETIVLR